MNTHNMKMGSSWGKININLRFMDIVALFVFFIYSSHG